MYNVYLFSRAMDADLFYVYVTRMLMIDAESKYLPAVGKHGVLVKSNDDSVRIKDEASKRGLFNRLVGVDA